MTVFDHRASIVAFLTAKAVLLDEECAAAEAEFEETDCHETMEEVARLSRQASLVRSLAAQVTRGDDLPAVNAATVTAASMVSQLPPLLAVGPMQNRGAQ